MDAVPTHLPQTALPSPLPSPVEPIDLERVAEDFVESFLSLDWWLREALPVGLRVAVIVILGLLVRWLILRALGKFMDGLTERSAREASRGGVDSVIAAERRRQRNVTLQSLFRNIINIVIGSMVVLLALSQFGFNLGPLLAGAGIAGVALGFGTQSLVEDFLSGIFILLEDQYGVGDVVDVGDAVGTVEEVQMRVTKIRSVDGSLWFVRNGQILRVGNKSQDWSRSLLDVGIAYGSDVTLAKRVLQETAREMAREPEFSDVFIDEPEMWGVQDLSADAVVLRLVVKTRPGAQFNAERVLRERIKAALDRNGIEIPFPQRTLWLRHDPEDPAPVELVEEGPHHH